VAGPEEAKVESSAVAVHDTIHLPALFGSHCAERSTVGPGLVQVLANCSEYGALVPVTHMTLASWLNEPEPTTVGALPTPMFSATPHADPVRERDTRATWVPDSQKRFTVPQEWFTPRTGFVATYVPSVKYSVEDQMPPNLWRKAILLLDPFVSSQAASRSTPLLWIEGFAAVHADVVKLSGPVHTTGSLSSLLMSGS